MMVDNLAFKQRSHLDPGLTNPPAIGEQFGKLVGRWINTDPDTQGLSEIVIEDHRGQLSVTPMGIGLNGPIAWPRANAKALANLDEEGGQKAIALEAVFDHGFMKSETYIRVNKGVLVIVLYNSFKDGSLRSDYVTREFFRRDNSAR